MDRADLFCYLDDVQYKKNEWQNRNRIKTARGWQWMTVPVHYRFPQRINEVEINNGANWSRKHAQALHTNYAKAPYFKEHIVLFESVYAKDWRYLCELNIELIEQLREALGLKHIESIRSSNLHLRDDPTDRLIDICKAVGADTYLAGQSGANYMDIDRFSESGIKVLFQTFAHPTHPQLFSDFQSHLSIVDLLFNCGPESMEIIREANKER
jgi:hypothetical protein